MTAPAWTQDPKVREAMARAEKVLLTVDGRGATVKRYVLDALLDAVAAASVEQARPARVARTSAPTATGATMTNDWTPDMPLRADATDEQIVQRGGWLMGYVAGADGKYRPKLVKGDGLWELAREFAAACVQGRRCPVCHNDE